MLKIFALLLMVLAFGALLADPTLNWPLRPGWLGAASLIAGTLAARAYWQRQSKLGTEPSQPERAVWLGMVGIGLVCGFVIATLLQPGSEFHLQTGDTGGQDSWMMLVAFVVCTQLLRGSGPGPDERDRAIANFALRVGYCSLVLMLLVLLLNLGFAPPQMLKRMTHWLLANTLLTLITSAVLIQYLAQLLCYWRDARQQGQAHG